MENNNKGTIQSLIDWVTFSEKEPPDIVKYYIVYDTDGDIKTLEWYHGDYFVSCSGGIWHDEEGEEVTNIVYWAEKPCI